MKQTQKKVTIYHDPITQKKLEGEAFVLSVLSKDGGTNQLLRCRVIFLSDGFITERLVNKQEYEA